METLEVEDDVEKNKRNLNSILRNPPTCLSFSEFMKKNNRSYFLLCWLEIERFKKKFLWEGKIEQAEALFNKYFSSVNPKIEIPEQLKLNFQTTIKNKFEITIFDEIQNFIFNILAIQDYPPFIKDFEHLKIKKTQNSNELENIPPPLFHSPSLNTPTKSINIPLKQHKNTYEQKYLVISHSAPNKIISTNEQNSITLQKMSQETIPDSKTSSPQPISFVTSFSLSTQKNTDLSSKRKMEDHKVDDNDDKTKNENIKLSNFEFSKTKIHHLSQLQNYTRNFISSSSLIFFYIHIFDTIELWNSMSFSSDTIIKEILISITEKLNEQFGSQRIWENYILLFNSIPMDISKKLLDYGIKSGDEIQFINKNNSNSIQQMDFEFNEDWNGINEDFKKLRLLLKNNNKENEIQEIFSNIQNKYSQCRKLLDDCFISIYKLHNDTKLSSNNNNYNDNNKDLIEKNMEKENITKMITSNLTNSNFQPPLPNKSKPAPPPKNDSSNDLFPRTKTSFQIMQQTKQKNKPLNIDEIIPSSSINNDSSILNSEKNSISLKEIQEELIEAIKRGDDIDTYLKMKELQINFQDETGCTALHWACKSGNSHAVFQLIQIPEIDINCSDVSGATPLHYAAYEGFVDIVEILVKHRDIDVEKKNNLKKKPKHIAKTKEIIQILNERKNKMKKDLDKAAQKRKNQLQHLRKLPSFRTLKKKAQGPTLEEMLNAPCYKQNLLQIFSNGKWKDRWIKLTKDCIIIDFPEAKNNNSSLKRCASDTDLRKNMKKSTSIPQRIDGQGQQLPSILVNDTIIFLSEVCSISTKDLPDINSMDFEVFADIKTGYVFGIYMEGLRPCFVRTNDKIDMAKWMLAIDGMISLKTNKSLMTKINKNSLLGILFDEEKMNDGKITSSEGEIWNCKSDGTLEMVHSDKITESMLENNKLIYQWNGKMFIPKDLNNFIYGVGVWHGLIIEWFSNTIDKNSPATYKYIWNDIKREFEDERGLVNYIQNLNSLYAENINKTEISNTNEIYKIEGSIPTIVVMFLPLLKNARIRFYKYEKLHNLLTEPKNYGFLIAMSDGVSTNKTDHLSLALTNIFQYHNKIVELICFCITQEIEKNEESGTLFRSNSVANKLLKFYLKMIGTKYLKDVLSGPIKMVNNSNLSYEIDILKIEESNQHENIEENVKNLKKATKHFFDAITNSLDKCPSPILRICHHLGKEVEKKYPTHSLLSIGGLMFLRYFCPAIIQPSSFGIIDGNIILTTNAKRGLVLIAKILQNLANQLPFKKQEEFMMPLNEFINENIPILKKFFQNIIDNPPSSLDSNVPVISISKETLLDSLGSVYLLLEQEFLSIEEYVENCKNNTNNKQILKILKEELLDVHLSKKIFNNSSIRSVRSITTPTKVENENHFPHSPSNNKITYEEFKYRLSVMSEEKALHLVLKILDDYEKENKLIYAFQNLFEEEPNTFAITIWVLDSEINKFNILEKMIKYHKIFLPNFINISNLSTEEIDDYLLKMNKEKCLNMTYFILKECEKEKCLRELLEEAYHIHTSKRFIFAFLLTLASIQDKNISGLEKINEHLENTLINTNNNKSVNYKSLLDSVMEELQLKKETAQNMEREAMERNDLNEIQFYRKEISVLEQEIESVKENFVRNRGNINKTNSNKSLVKTNSNNRLSSSTSSLPEVFSCYSCQKPIVGEGYVIRESHEYCRSCAYKEK